MSRRSPNTPSSISREEVPKILELMTGLDQMITERLASSDELMTSILLNDPQVLCVDEEDNLFYCIR